jgi:chromosome segregation protein
VYIESIELDNFKSFGEKTFIPFFPGFTTVSGPNGSGKSNIIDSLLYCFGLSTNKTMRAERLTDLMNNLSGKRETTVSVVLYDEQSESQLKIARRIRVKPNGQYESTYLINSKIVTLAEVHDQLALRNISSNAYNIVMQGDVTRIISMSPLERRRIIDELAGVAEFDRKIDEAKIEIAQANDSLEKQAILLSEFSDRLEILRKERDQAIKYTELRNRRNYLERLFRQARIRELEDKAVKIKAEIEKKVELKTGLLTEMGDLSEKYIDLELKFKEVGSQLESFNNEGRLKLQAQLDAQRERVTKGESGIEFLHKQVGDYERQVERIIKERKVGEKKILEVGKGVKEIEDREQHVQAQLDAIQEQYQKVQNKILKISQSDNLSAGKVLELQQEVNALQNNRSALITERALCEQNLARIEEEIVFLREELQKSLEGLKANESKTQNSQSTLLTDKINSATQYLRRLKTELSDTELEVKERTQQMFGYQQELSKLEMKRQVAEEQNWGRAIETVLRSGINGIHGVLAQLATVSPQYSQALEIAAGARLKSIVVENDGVGAQLIEYLRRNNAGRATFLPLNKIREPHYENLPAEAKSTSSGIIDWAINLVQCDDLFVPAFSYAFGSTLIVKDMASGRRYLGRYRMVTQQGDLLEKSGAMSGGSSPREGGIHFGVEENAKTQALEKQIESLHKRIGSLQSSINELKAEIAQTENELDAMKNEWAGLKASEDVRDIGLKNLREQSEIYKARLTALARERELLERQIKTTASEIFNYEHQISKVSDSLAKEGSRVKDSGLESLINESQEVEFERKKLEVALKNFDSEKGELLKGIESIKGGLSKGDEEIGQAHSQVTVLKEQIALQEEALISDRDVLKALELAFEELQGKIRFLEKAKDELSALIIDLTEKKTQLAEHIKRVSQEIADGKVKLLDIEERLAGLRQEVLNAEITELQQNDLDTELKQRDQSLSQEQVREELDRVEKRMTALEPVNMKAIDEYNEVFERLTEVKERCEGLSAEREEIERRINSYSDHKHKSFFEAFDDVNKHFQEIFAELSFGQGELILENQEDPFKGGLVIQARPRNKKMQRLESMSGGEKSLTALSFIFALQWHNPAPFYAFDEVDMFLDGLNAERLARMVKKQSGLAQFIVVSLRKPMIGASERAIGVCLGKDGFSKVAGMKSKENVKRGDKSSEDLREAALAS